MPFEVHFGCWGWPWTSCWRPLEMPRAWPGSRTGPGTPEWAGLHSRPGGSTVLPGSRDPGHGPSWGRFACSGPYYQFNNCLIQGTFISELLDSRLRKVTVELLTGQILRSLVAPSSRGRRININGISNNINDTFIWIGIPSPTYGVSGLPQVFLFIYAVPF